MKKYYLQLLNSLGYKSSIELTKNMLPSIKYSATCKVLVLSILIAVLERVLDIESIALAALSIACVIELVSHILTHFIRKEKIASTKVIRSTLRLFISLFLLWTVWKLSCNFEVLGKLTISTIISWINSVLIIHLFLEYSISASENLKILLSKKA